MTCPNCGSTDTISAHSHGDLKRICNDCHQGYTDERPLKSQATKITRSEHAWYHCPLCSSVCPKKTELEDHIYNTHDRTEVSQYIQDFID